MSVWAGLTLAGLGYVAWFTHNLPWADEWEFVPALTGQEPIPRWLWTQHNEHRLPLPRLLYLLLFRVTGDFRAGCFLQILMLSALSWWLMRVAAGVRGESRWEDAFFPAGLLNWGHAENFLMGYQINFVLVCGFACGLVVTANASTIANRFQTGVRAGVLLLLLEMCGGTGLAFVPTVGLWLVWLGIAELRDGRWRGVLLLGIVAVAVGYIGVYFQGYARPPGHPPPAWGEPLRIANVTVQYLAMSLGYGVRSGWGIAAAVVVGVVGVMFWHLGRRWRVEVESRPRVLGMFAVLGGILGLAMAVGAGRSGFRSDEMGLWSRYGLLAWPVLATAFLTFSHQWRWMQTVLCGVTLMLLPGNFGAGWTWGVGLDSWLETIEADVRAGVPTEEIVGHRLRGSGQEERAIRGMPMLRDARVGVFRHLGGEP